MTGATAICARCKGTGKLVIRTDYLNQRGETIGHKSRTQSCGCVRNLPEIPGTASWWEVETVWRAVFTEALLRDETAEITVSVEVPRRDDGRRVPLRGNRYWPSLAELMLPENMVLNEAGCRELAAQLAAAADKIAEIDGACVDACGHWAPCTCGKDAAA